MNMREIICGCCGTSFTADHGRTKYCSGNCRRVIRKGKQHKYCRENRRYAQYGLTEELFELLLTGQEYQCAICQKELSFEKTKASKPHIDHDHISNEVRGILCLGCNVALGYFGDSIENLARAISYLKNFREKREQSINTV